MFLGIFLCLCGWDLAGWHTFGLRVVSAVDGSRSVRNFLVKIVARDLKPVVASVYPPQAERAYLLNERLDLVFQTREFQYPKFPADIKGIGLRLPRGGGGGGGDSVAFSTLGLLVGDTFIRVVGGLAVNYTLNPFTAPVTRYYPYVRYLDASTQPPSDAYIESDVPLEIMAAPLPAPSVSTFNASVTTSLLVPIATNSFLLPANLTGYVWTVRFSFIPLGPIAPSVLRVYPAVLVLPPSSNVTFISVNVTIPANSLPSARSLGGPTWAVQAGVEVLVSSPGYFADVVLGATKVDVFLSAVSTSDDNDDDGVNKAAIIGGVIGGVVGLAILIVILVKCCRRGPHDDHSKIPEDRGAEYESYSNYGSSTR